jgi:membrane associated rhomboid family serine protease
MFFRISPVIRNLLIINVIVFIAQSIIPNLTNYIALWGVQTSYFKPYQLFTYMFAHADFFHIFFNMLLLIFCGPMLEEYWGQKKFLFFYLAAGIGAGAFGFFFIHDWGIWGGVRCINRIWNYLCEYGNEVALASNII